jgi:hypothetical protein
MCLIPVGDCSNIPTNSVIFALLINRFSGAEIKKDWMDKVARIGDSRDAYRILIRKLEGKILIGVDKRILLKWILKK